MHYIYIQINCAIFYFKYNIIISYCYLLLHNSTNFESNLDKLCHSVSLYLFHTGLIQCICHYSYHAFVCNSLHYNTCNSYIFRILYFFSLEFGCPECDYKCTRSCHLSDQKCPHQPNWIILLKYMLEVSTTVIITFFEYIKLSEHSTYRISDPWKPISLSDNLLVKCKNTIHKVNATIVPHYLYIISYYSLVKSGCHYDCLPRISLSSMIFKLLYTYKQELLKLNVINLSYIYRR